MDDKDDDGDDDDDNDNQNFGQIVIESNKWRRREGKKISSS